jgi:transforming growth factor-beta-induced protein
VLATLPTLAQGTTILDVVKSRADLSILASVVEAAEPAIAETLSRTDIPGLTLLAPNNEAFTRLGLYFDVDLAFFIENPALTSKLLRYHVLTGFFRLADIAVYNGGVVLTALPDTSIRVTVTENGNVRLNIADVIEGDVRASNGRIHIIDDVIFTSALDEEIRAEITKWKAFKAEIEALPADSVIGLVRDTPDLSTLFKVIIAADQLRLLRDGFPFTVFAPTNAAFEALFGALGVTADEALANKDLLKTVLRYHILDDVYTAADLVAGTYETLDGEGIVVSTTEEGGVVLNGNVNVVMADVTGFNVVVHVVDSVLLPPSYTLAQKKATALANVNPRSVLGRLVGDSRFSTLVDLLVAADLTNAIPAGSTVFAPTNAAFNAAFRALGVSKEQVLLNPSLVSDLLPYHVLPVVARASAVVELDKQTVSTLDGDLILVEITDEGGVVLNGVANVIETDITALNGVVHAIDAVLTEKLLAKRVAAREALASSARADSVAFIAATNPDFSILADVIVATGQDKLLGTGFPFTVFAPTNAAFEAVLANMGVSLDAALRDNVDMLREVLRYHVLEDQVMSGDITDGLVYQSLQGEYMQFSVADGVVKINGVATVTTADVEASNGVIHVIDTVLTLPSKTLADAREAALANLKEGSIVAIAAADEQFSILVDVIVLTNSTRLLDQGFPFTVFAPTNDAFRAAFRALGVSQGEAYLNPALLREVLRYHILEDQVMSADIEDGAEVETLQGGMLTFSVDGDVIMVNDATVVAADIEAANGVIHVIDAVLVPAE